MEGRPFGGRSACAHFFFHASQGGDECSVSLPCACTKRLVVFRQACCATCCVRRTAVGCTHMRASEKKYRLLYLFRRYDNLTVTLQHDTENQGHFCTLLARGSPYMTFEFAGATPRISSNGEILEVYIYHIMPCGAQLLIARNVTYRRETHSGRIRERADWVHV